MYWNGIDRLDPSAAMLTSAARGSGVRLAGGVLIGCPGA